MLEALIRSFDNQIIALNITDAARKKALLLHLAGEQVYDVFKDSSLRT